MISISNTLRILARPASILLGVLFPLLLCLPAPAASDEPTLSLEPSFGSAMQIGAWTPLRLNIISNGPEFSGSVRLRIGPITYERRLSLPASSERRLSFHVLPFEALSSAEIELESSNGTISRRQVGLTLKEAPSGQPLIVVLTAPGERNPLDGIALPGAAFAEADPADQILEDPRSFDAADAVLLTEAALPSVHLATRRALSQFMADGGTVILVLPADVNPEQAFRSWYEREADGSSADSPRPQFAPGFGLMSIGRGRLIYLSQSALLAHQASEAFRSRLAGILTPRRGAGDLSSVDESLYGSFGKARWPWLLKSQWLLAIAAYILVMAGFMLPSLRQQRPAKFYLGAAVASAIFAVVFHFLAVPSSPTVLASFDTVTTSAGSPIVKTERLLRVSALRTGHCTVAFDGMRDIKPLFLSWSQLQQARFTLLESEASSEWQLPLAAGEERWFRGLRLSRAASPQIALRQGTPPTLRLADLPAQLRSPVLRIGGEAIPLPTIPKGDSLISVKADTLPFSTAISRTAKSDVAAFRLAIRWQRSAPAAVCLLGWTSPAKGAFTGSVGARSSHAALSVIELEASTPKSR